ncbi:MAG: TRAP transporter large permease subunit, partial [Bacteroidales bacterium]|nr:TRAP transporter large permease subunit [Bacteroidales bacterium]
DKSLALGSVMAGGVLGEIIPPSIIMIIFAYINKLSIARLFLGGIGPGLLTAVLFAIYILLRCYLQPHLAPVSAEQVTWKTRLISLREILPPVFLIIAVLGSILTGLATPVEASSIGAIGTLVICIVYRRFTWKGLADACRENLKITCMVMWIMIGANMFRVLLTGAGVQEMLLDLVNGMEVNRWFIIIAMQILLIIFGMVMDDFALVVICSPIFLPIVVALGFDPLWFAIIFILNMQMALLTPPFGWALILMRGLAPPGVNTKDIWMSVPPFAAVQLLMLIITMLFPPLATWLPGKIM